LVQKTEGEVLIHGHNIDIDFETAKSYIGVVPQEFNFNPFLKVLDIILNQAGYYGIRRRKARVLAERYMKPLGLWDRRNQVAMTLSGGFKRRLMIARALIHEPKILILDEPTAGVDISVRRSMWQFLQQLNQAGTTIILTTHYLEEAEQLCRHIAIIDQGHIVVNTSMPEILKRLDSERFILYLQDPLPKAPVISGYSFWLLDSMTLEVEVPKGMSMSQLFETLQQANVTIATLRNKANRLEELFLRLTGDPIH
jgi:ABC-2 type transport system ATP-binding protein